MSKLRLPNEDELVYAMYVEDNQEGTTIEWYETEQLALADGEHAIALAQRDADDGLEVNTAVYVFKLIKQGSVVVKKGVAK